MRSGPSQLCGVHTARENIGSGNRRTEKRRNPLAQSAAEAVDIGDGDLADYPLGFRVRYEGDLVSGRV